MDRTGGAIESAVKNALDRAVSTINELQSVAESSFPSAEDIRAEYEALSEEEQSEVIANNLIFSLTQVKATLQNTNLDSLSSLFVNLHNPEVLEGILLGVEPRYRDLYRNAAKLLYCYLFPPAKYPFSKRLIEEIKVFVGVDETFKSALE